MESAETWLRKNKVVRIELSIVAQFDRLQRYYERLGYIPQEKKYFPSLPFFLAARWVRIPVARFSIGFGPKLWGYKKGNTEYWLSLIPIGGYVLPEIEDETEFFKIPIYKRVIFSIGGPVANMAF